MDPRIERGMTAQRRLRADALAAGARPIGWKTAFGTKPAMKKMGLDAPLVGFMTDRGRLVPGAVVDVGGWAKPVVEMEIAVSIATDLPDGLAEKDAAAAIAGLGPAFELVDPSGSLTDVEEVLSANIYHRHVVPGPIDGTRGGGRIDGLQGLITHNDGSPIEVADVAANSGAPLEVVIGAARHLAALGEPLRKGDIVICGSIIPPIFAKAGDTIRYQLLPFDPITVTLR